MQTPQPHGIPIMAKRPKGTTVPPSVPDNLPQPSTNGKPAKPRRCYQCGRHPAVSIPGCGMLSVLELFCGPACASNYALSKLSKIKLGYCEKHECWLDPRQDCPACAFNQQNDKDLQAMARIRGERDA